MSERDFGGFLAKSFAVLERELPEAYARFCRQLALSEVAIDVDGESVAVRFTTEGVRMQPAPDRPRIEVQTTRNAILSLIDARTSLVDAVLADELLLRGSTEDLLRFHDALMTYIHGAVRAPSFPALLRAYRSEGEQSQVSLRARLHGPSQEVSWTRDPRTNATRPR